MPMFFWFTLLGVCGVGVIETKSIYEPANKKEKDEQEVAKRVAILIAKAVSEHAGDTKRVAAEVVEEVLRMKGKEDVVNG